MKKNKGITLIALVITIIVLLILAGVSIATLLGENGILAQATKAERAQKLAEITESIQTDILAKQMEKTNGKITEKELDEVFAKYDKDYNPENPQVKTDEDGRKYIETSDGDIIYQDTVYTGTVTKANITDTSKIKIGDYVNYSPDTTKTSYTFEENLSGYIKQEIPKDQLKWRILDIDEQGKVKLISDTLTSKIITLKGARGYNNGVFLLNEMCNELYRNDTIGATARSLNIEDIQERMKTGADGKKEYEKYGSGTNYEYGKVKEYADNRKYPLQWQHDKGIEGKNEDRDLIEAEEEGLNFSYGEKSADEKLMVTGTYWALTADIMQSNLMAIPEDKVRDISKANSMYYELFFNCGGPYYWLANRIEDLSSDSKVSFRITSFTYSSYWKK